MFAVCRASRVRHAGAVALAIFIAACGPSDAPPGGASVPAEASVPAVAGIPAEAGALGPVHALSVTDLEGRSVSLAQFAGRPMIIEIWATWCGPCRRNRQLVHELKKEFPDRLVVIGVSVDSKASLVTNFLRSNPANEHEFMATPEFMQLVATRSTSNAIPKTMYVNGRGQIVDVSEGVQGAKWVRAMAKNLK
jgi:thiol-disulfide isomerase/thioredoxin